MKITRQFLIDYSGCAEGYRTTLELGLMDKELIEVEQGLRANSFTDYADWLLNTKSTEKYVRENGSIFTMGAYQVFNPLTGIHTRYETEAEAKAALIEVSKQVLELHCPQVVQELSNENGDTTWVPTEIHKTLVIS